ncbi:protein spire homolog 1 isoform X1 [Gasterosteus aculeatus]|uniref:KIND domain-containing protein n=1 Tax=Gasterosteus aculeatus aculeatus TaxID=481459 RepID=G3NL68_GASAC|nr:protein spire homolog 1 isoform X2 [Gasterosteus aculeatus aculeatus]XP_040020020.1 protein spire homolog 1 isoform X2 [Gasterosteus aculeatus aculeatus]XP_040020021.1 protein spire homolog 1 isoform X2 [Gasterosteus aculeatus aculeatus]XP_040020022.1 protein spire homolog 1 isoform X2 [Gasterosteus aculeatus aculeatus]XP_040020023.1 protein spire homolog 1 isoform X2 [Gasterosteus aculeatus aculeatus]XP_040020024.1 protein spire homolog 1 isoform X2 [Gasterosteus aculeatus aculeatus]XP_04
MAERRRGDQGGLTGAAAATHRDEKQRRSAMSSSEDAAVEGLSLEEILRLYSQPINEEQAWAVCYQCCRTLAREHRSRGSSSAAGASSAAAPRKITGPEDVRIQRDGSVSLQQRDREGKYSPCTTTEVIESLGIMIYKALDYGLKENEERELSPPLEQLIDLMTNMAEAERDACPDEGYEATEEEDEAEDDAGNICSVPGYRDIFKLCTAHLPALSDTPTHYQAVCRALYTETKELGTFLEKIRSAKENLRKMEDGPSGDPGRDLNELQNADWARFWVQVMRDLREGVKLKKVQERQYNPLPIEYQLTPYEMLMDDIRSKRYKLRKVMVNGSIPQRLKKSAHEVILDFIRSRPPLNPVSARKLKPQTELPPTLHERILKEIKSERKLRPVSPGEVRRGMLGHGKTRSVPQDLFRTGRDEFSPYMGRRTSSSLSLANGSACSRAEPSGSQSVPPRKRLLKAPSLAELDSSDSDDEIFGHRSASSSSVATSMMDDTSPECALGKKTPPSFLPISSTPQPERRQTPQRRHSIEKETPTNVRLFQPPSKKNSKSLEEFCFPVECLSLTVEEVMHIRQVLVKAELEKFQQYKDIYNAMKKGKLCFCCRSKRFSFFTWSYICQFCKKPVCAQCCKKMRLPSKPYSSLPIYSIGSTNTLPRERVSAIAAVGQGLSVAGDPGPSSVGGATASPTVKVGKAGAPKRAAPEAAAKSEKSTSSPQRHGIHKTMSKFSKHGSLKSHEELELPSELTEDWATMEVCVDCKKFITDIIASSKHSLSLATKRARLKRKTQSFYLSSPKGREEYRPSERTIKEI